jgi:regulation of enolase protein 1 (concanavalin A-like superfamily)
MIAEVNLLLDKNWEESEKILIKKILDNLIYYKSLIPKSLKNDVKSILEMANKIKVDYDNLLDKYNKCICRIEEKDLTKNIIEEEENGEVTNVATVVDKENKDVVVTEIREMEFDWGVVPEGDLIEIQRIVRPN